MEWGFGGAEVGWGVQIQASSAVGLAAKKQAPAEETITDK